MRLKSLIRISNAKKLIVGLSGLGISGFALMHMSGNLLLFRGAEAYNRYGHGIVTNPFFLVGEMGVLGCFVLHIFFTILLVRENRLAKGHSGAVAASGKKRTSFAAKTMIISGLLLLAFVILHLITFKFGPHYIATYDGLQVRDLHKLVAEKFQSPLYVGWYVFSMAILALHLSHGFTASFQSLGLWSVRRRGLKVAGYIFAAVVAGGFAAQPLFFFCGGCSQ